MLDEEEKKRREREFDAYFSNGNTALADEEIKRRSEEFDNMFGNHNSYFTKENGFESDPEIIKKEINEIINSPVEKRSNKSKIQVVNDDNIYETPVNNRYEPLIKNNKAENNTKNNTTVNRSKIIYDNLEKQSYNQKLFNERANTDKSSISQLLKTLKNFFLGGSSGTKDFVNYATEPNHSKQQEANLLAGGRNDEIVELYKKNIKEKDALMKSGKNSNVDRLYNTNEKEVINLYNSNQKNLAQANMLLDNPKDLENAPKYEGYYNSELPRHQTYYSSDNSNIDKKIEEYTDAFGNIELDKNRASLTKSIAKDRNEIANNINEISNPVLKKIAEIAPSTGNSLVGAGVSMVNPYLGSTYFMISAAGSYEYDGRLRGMSKQEARTYGTMMGFMEGASEMLEIDNFIKAGKFTSKGAFKKAFKHYGIDMLDNAIQEAVIDPIDEVIAKYSAGKEYQKNEYSTKNGWSNLLDDMVQDGIDGALSSLLMNGISLGINSSVNLYDKIMNGNTVSKEDINRAYTDINNNENIDVNEHVKKAFEEQKDKILNSNKNTYTVIDFNTDSDYINLKEVVGETIKLENNQLNIKPAVVLIDGYYNIIDSQTGLKLDTTMYNTKDMAVKGFNEIIRKIDSATINNLNQKIIQANLVIQNKMNEINKKSIENPQEIQNQAYIQIEGNDKLFSNSEFMELLHESNNLNTSQNYENENIDSFSSKTINNTKIENQDNIEQIKRDSVNFEKQINDVLSGTFPRNDMLTILTQTPKPLLDIGLTDLPITMTQKHLKTIMNSTGSDKNANYHDLGIDIVKQLPEALSNPLDIVQSTTKSDSVVLTTYLADKQDRTVIASIKIDGKGRINDIRFDTNVMTSAYGRNNYDKFMRKNIDDGNLLYDVDRGVIKKVTGARLQLPRSSNSTTNNGSVNTSITQKNNSVKNGNSDV